MAQMSANFKYSPVNSVIIDWAYNGKTFDSCGLPRPHCYDTPEPKATACKAIPIADAIDVTDLARWLPEVMVGLSDPNEEIAASYIRETIIDFAVRSQVLRRDIFLVASSGDATLPIEPYAEERVAGVLSAQTLDGRRCKCSQDTVGDLQSFKFKFNKARSQIEIEGRICSPTVIHIEAWACPTESSCLQDAVIYEQNRRAVSNEARRRYIQAYHFSDILALRSISSPAEFTSAILAAKRDAVGSNLVSHVPFSPLFSGRACRRFR